AAGDATQREPQAGDAGETRIEFLAVRGDAAGSGGGAQQTAEAAGGVEHGAAGDVGESGHELGELVRGRGGAQAGPLLEARPQVVEGGLDAAFGGECGDLVEQRSEPWLGGDAGFGLAAVNPEQVRPDRAEGFAGVVTDGEELLPEPVLCGESGELALSP